MAYREITEVVDGTLVPLDSQILEYSQPNLVFFGPRAAQQLADNPAACNILVYGTIGEEDYGQNLPFISPYLRGPLLFLDVAGAGVLYTPDFDILQDLA